MQAWQQFTGGVLIIVIAAVVFRAAGLKDVDFGSAADWFSGIATFAAVAIALHQAFEPARARAREEKAKGEARIDALHHTIQVCWMARQNAASAIRVMTENFHQRQRAFENFKRRVEPAYARWSLVEPRDLLSAERNMAPEITAILKNLPIELSKLACIPTDKFYPGDLFALEVAMETLEVFENHCRKKADEAVARR
jgi:hypothetical protein